MIYLDNAATSRVFTEVREVMDRYLCEEFYNPSSLYGASLNVKNNLDQAREVIAAKLGCFKNEIYFTSCATESNNWVLNCGKKYKRGNIVTTIGEHTSVYEATCNIKGGGADVRFAKLAPSGAVDMNDLFSKIDSETALVSIIHCSNETGAVNDLKQIALEIRRRASKALIHSDGVQAFCKIDVNLRHLDLDFYSLSAHKIGGPKGVGLLYINKKHNIAPFLYGGGQERGFRSGTENTAGIMGFSKAVEIYSNKYQKIKVKEMRSHMLESLLKIPNVIINGTTDFQSDFIISASILGINGEILQNILSDKGILIGLGSACSSKTKNNRVLNALGRSSKEISGSIRISFSPENIKDEIIFATEEITKNIIELRKKING